MKELPEDLYEKITALCGKGDELAENDEHGKAIEKYRTAWKMLPEPRHTWEAATWILSAIGDAYFFSGDFTKAYDSFKEAVVNECPGAIENPFVQLRRGQCALELGDEAKAAECLLGAYMLHGEEIFEEEDPKYFTWLKSKVKPPKGGWKKS